MSMVEDQGFKSMISVPGYTLPTRTHFTQLMERKYQEIFQKVKGDINNTETDVATEAYLGITCHYVAATRRQTYSYEHRRIVGGCRDKV